MSLVDYESSSDEESFCSDNIENNNAGKATIIEKNVHSNKNTENDLDNIQKNQILIPHPLQSFTMESIFKTLPSPKVNSRNHSEIIEDDDEFLHKKCHKADQQARLLNKRTPVKITVPSLKDFTDVDKELAEKAQYQKIKFINGKSKSSSLLSILPKPKSEEIFVKNLKNQSSHNNNIKMSAFIPDTVRSKRPSINTEDIDCNQFKKKKIYDKKEDLTEYSSDSDIEDDYNNKSKNFFYLDNDQNLPEISVHEIQAMVTKKAEKISEATTKFLNKWPKHINETQTQDCRAEANSKELDLQAVQALIGSSVRKSQNVENIQVIELSSEEILPNRDEWVRTALATSTGYQVTGVLVDEEPSSGTKRKHQITYLAHKAKANEAELQAMWAANRQNRRATQSKYGF